MKNYVWLNIKTGEFSNSWDETIMTKLNDTPESLTEDHDDNSPWKLIEYQCFNDTGFQFYNIMKIVTNR